MNHTCDWNDYGCDFEAGDRVKVAHKDMRGARGIIVSFHITKNDHVVVKLDNGHLVGGPADAFMREAGAPYATI